MKLNIPPYINKIAPYEAGKPIEALEREYGIRDSIKLASNENPLGPSPKAQAAVRAAVANLHRYPDEPGYRLLQRIARQIKVAPEQIIVGNGSDEILGFLAQALLQPGDEVIVPTPSFLMYTIVTQCAGATPVMVPLKQMTIDLDAVLDRVNDKTRLIFICNPNNPTGTLLTQSTLDTFLKALPADIVVVIDEAYIDFVQDTRCARGLSFLDGEPPVVTLRTFSKAYGLAGLRVGYGVMPAQVAELLNRVRMPFNVNALAQTAAVAALDDTDFLNKTISLVHGGLDFFYAALDKRQVRYFKSQTNFFLIDLACDAKVVFDQLLRQGVIVRPMTAYGYPQYIRINVGLPGENQRFLDALDLILAGMAPLA
jgi:histidinol-phosphate aminotransferase